MKFFFPSLVIAACLSGSAAQKPEKQGTKIRANASKEVEHNTSRRTHGVPRQWQPRIVGGTEVPDGEYPFFVQADLCGASLIWKDIVLTAAHCRGGIANNQGQVLVGAHEVDTTSSNTQWMDVEQEIPHPNYNDNTLSHDYMIVKLSSSVTNPNIPTVGLAGDTTALNPGDDLTVIGFGATSEGGPGSDTLLEVDVDYLSSETCNDVYGNEYEPDVMFCAGNYPSGGLDSCQGDSGGPIFKDGYQVGVVSWGFGCAQPNFPGVYATVSSQIEWIKQMVCQNSDDPPAWACDGGASPVPPGTNLGPGGPTPSTSSPTKAPTAKPPQGTPTPSPTKAPVNPPSGGSATIQVTVEHDDYPEETSWYLIDEDEMLLIWQDGGSVTTQGAIVTESASVPPGKYYFVIDDEFGDGICCSYGQGSYEVSVNGVELYSGGSFSYTSGPLPICIDANGVASACAEYYLSFSYDFYPEEIAARIVHVATGDEIINVPEADVSYANQFRAEMVNLVPGEEYELIVTDTYGDGMPDDNCFDSSAEFYVAVDAYIGGELVLGDGEFALIDGCDFESFASQTFTVPTTLGSRKKPRDSKTKSAQKTSLKRNTASFCSNTLDTFIVRGVEQNCPWMEANWPKSEQFCEQPEVARACPSTCGTCDLVN